MIEALLLQSGYRVGSTLSPHIWFNERIRHMGAMQTTQRFALPCRVDLARGDIPLTYFEFSTGCLVLHRQGQVGGDS